MTQFLWFLVGLLIGGCVGVAILCCLQINRICYYEQEIHKLRNKLNQKY